MGWKMIYLAKRNPSLAAEAFSEAWRGHSALGAGCTNVRDKVIQVMQCSRVLAEPNVPGASTDYDGVNLLEVKSQQAANDIWDDAETLAIMRPDEPRVFSTYVRQFSLVCESMALRDVPRGQCVVVGFLKAAGALASQVELQQADISGAQRVVWNRVAQTPPPGYEFDAIVEWWFADAAAALTALGAQGVGAALPTAFKLNIDLSRSVFMFTQVTHSRP
jgi:hypothetical protein